MLGAVRARILGVVLNHVDAGSFRGEGYGYYYRHDNESASAGRAEGDRSGSSRGHRWDRP